jgi:ribosomal protein S12
MSTNNQLVKNKRKNRKNYSRAPKLSGCPQKRGTCLKVF